MNDSQLGPGAERALARAREEAARLGHDVVGAEHLLLGVLLSSDLAGQLVGTLGIDRERAAERLASGQRRVRPRGEPAEGGLPLSSHARRLLDAARRDAAARGTSVEDAHLLVAAFAEPRGTLASILHDAGVPADRARAALFEASGLAPTEPAPAPERPERPEPKEPADAPPAPTPEEVAAREAAREQARAERERRREEQRERQKERERQRAERMAARKAQGTEAPVAPERAAKARDTAGEGRRGRRDEAPEAAPAPKVPSVGKLAPKPKQRGPVWRYLLLAFVPASIALSAMHAAPILVFLSACLAVLPLAGFMGEATEHLAHRTGPTVGGLLNATFGNAAELIIAVVALRAGLVELVKASITGSILGNLLLIMGLSLVAGGLRVPDLRFNRTAAGMSAAMLALAVVSLVLPAIFHAAHPEPAAAASERLLSEGVGIVLLVTYAFSLLFTLRTHKRLFGGEPHPTEGPVWGPLKAVAVLALATVGVAVESEILVHATEQVTATLGLSQAFLGLIVIPIIGNAAEHAAAIMVARKGQMDLSLQIALGSSTQIALLVAPLLVFAGVLLGQPMNLVFSPFEVAVLALATGVATVITLDGESHWFEGVQLLAVYAMVGVAAWFI